MEKTKLSSVNFENETSKRKMKVGLSVVVFFGAVVAFACAAVLIRASREKKHFREDLTLSSCVGRCTANGTVPNVCQCNSRCIKYNDCCPDYSTLCLRGSCVGRCGSPFNGDQPCQCNTGCEKFGDCCPDFRSTCQQLSEPITDDELKTLSEDLFRLEGPNNVAAYIQYKPQKNTTSTSGCVEDRDLLPLLTVAPAAYQVGTIALLMAMHDNYEADVSVPENQTAEHTAEMNAFLDAVIATPIMVRLKTFLTSKKVTFNKAKLQEMWFGLYSRSGSGTVLGSSGFEHVFLGELKNGVSGFHNWVFFSKQEEAGRLNYLGQIGFMDLGTKGAIIQDKFEWRETCKPISSMLIGTSPEFELAIYSLCWLTRPDSATCPMSFGGRNVPVTTYSIGASKQFVASAYAM